MIRVGIGYDVHRLVPGRKLILGGVDIPYTQGLLGHSDADVLTHALCDAVLGALGAGDIGGHFPDSDASYKDVCSLDLLAHVASLMRKQQYCIGNVDAVIIAERPKLRNFIASMCMKLSQALNCPPECINIKATTTEGLGFTGHGEGIAAQAIVCLTTLPQCCSESKTY